MKRAKRKTCRHGAIVSALKNKTSFIIGSRGSQLALQQAKTIQTRLQSLSPRVEIKIEIIKTTGDRLQSAPLSIIGGQGVFTKELEEALLDERIDIAVHSLKDLPTLLPTGLSIAAVTEREDPRDALVLPANYSQNDSSLLPSLASLREGAIIGTSSLRRASQLKHFNPRLVIKELRGNVDTRLGKLDRGEYDAIILAAAGLRRLNLAQRISSYISIEEILPAVGQGALAIETRTDDDQTNSFVKNLNHQQTELACTAERAFLRTLGGGCQLPIAAHAVVSNRLQLYGLVANHAGEILLRESIEGEANDAQQLGEMLAERLMKRGAIRLIQDSQSDETLTSQ
ncbi:MAG: hydroxymethylbilane synthase [Pyrinomonadaceae bacterium]|nr:hydroxymethylbilane synthase [Pyrinomonadaceae bacterium]